MIRLLSYNIHGGTGTDGLHDYARINRLMENHNIDIALLQEVDTRPVQRSTDQDICDLCGLRFKYFVPGISVISAEGWYGNAILSRFPVIKHQVIDVSYPGREPRNIIEAVIDTPLGPVRVLNTHKGLNHKERKSQLKKLHELLRDRCPDTPLFVAGDMNVWHTSARALFELNNYLNPIDLGATFPTFFPLFKLDRAWYRAPLKVVSACVLKTNESRIYSDHYPVIIDLGL